MISCSLLCLQELYSCRMRRPARIAPQPLSSRWPSFSLFPLARSSGPSEQPPTPPQPCAVLLTLIYFLLHYSSLYCVLDFVYCVFTFNTNTNSYCKVLFWYLAINSFWLKRNPSLSTCSPSLAWPTYPTISGWWKWVKLICEKNYLLGNINSLLRDAFSVLLK